MTSTRSLPFGLRYGGGLKALQDLAGQQHFALRQEGLRVGLPVTDEHPRLRASAAANRGRLYVGQKPNAIADLRDPIRRRRCCAHVGRIAPAMLGRRHRSGPRLAGTPATPMAVEGLARVAEGGAAEEILGGAHRACLRVEDPVRRARADGAAACPRSVNCPNDRSSARRRPSRNV